MFVVAITVVCVRPAIADILLPPPTLPYITYGGFVQITSDNDEGGSSNPPSVPVTGPQTIQQAGSSLTVTGAYAGVTFTNGIDPMLSGSFHAFAHGPEIATASAVGVMTATYDFYLSGPTTTVGVIVGANGKATGEGVDAVFTLSALNGPTIINHYLPYGAGQWNESSIQMLQTNQAYQVYMEVQGEADAAANGSGLDVAQTDVTVDPSFTIDPSFLNASEYSITFSPGVLSAVPEPSTWAMMILGFCGIGAMAYRRRKSPMLAACAVFCGNIDSAAKV
jgi:hypothetical protein